MIDKDDLAKYDKFVQIIESGSFKFKGNAVIPVALLFDWFRGLGPKLRWAMTAGTIKKIESPVKPIKKAKKVSK